MKKFIIIKIILLLAILFTLQSNMSLSADYNPHNPITIDGNEGFSEENGVVSGTGTKADPYIIENWKITAEGVEYGINISNTNVHFIIRDCKITKAESSGIQLTSIENGKVEDCQLIDIESGITVKESKIVEVVSNSITGSSYGIDLNNTTSSLIQNNIVSEGKYGLYAEYSTNNVIKGNTFKLNEKLGGYLSSTSQFNLFYHNNFIDNGMGNANDYGMNNWNKKNGDGNYWDDYLGKDLDNDGIGDTAYRIWGSDVNFDYHPLMKPWSK